MTPPPPVALLRAMLDAAIASAQPANCLAPHLPQAQDISGQLVVIGAGKAASNMARVVEQHHTGPLRGVVVTPYGHGVPCQRIRVLEAAHPVPDAAGERAARELMGAVSGLTPHDTVLALISGGGSALLPMPLPGLSLTDKQAVNRALLACGASIGEINIVRRHLSAIKGGRLALACHPARVITLMISDVPGDAPADIASGPTVADASTCAEAMDIVQRYRLPLPPNVWAALHTPEAESVKPQHPALAGHQTTLVATPALALQAAAAVAQQQGVAVHVLGDAIEGEAKDVGKILAGMATHVAQHQQPFKTPCILLSGGETTVTLHGQGSGGRNVECLLAFALAMRGAPGVHALMADTDGTDGTRPVAGAWTGPGTLAQGWAAGVNPAQSLANNDAHSFFETVQSTVVTGPTHTNVNDFRAVYIE